MRVAIGLAFVLAAAVTLEAQPASAAGPSFDCAKAGNWVEKQICGNDALAALDAWFAPLYGQVAQRLTGKDLDDLKARRKAWLKQRNDCRAEADGTACLKTRYQEFTADLERQFAQLAGGGSGAAASAPAAKSPLAECAGKSDAPGCLEQLVETEEANLASAEANVAWRAYRNSECKRRQQAGGDDAAAAYSSCLVELTRARIRELQS